jgi:glycosyltransferase involved in cell wall biosynthesis
VRIGILGLRGFPFQDAYGKIVAQVGPRLVERGHQVTVFVRSKWARKGVTSHAGLSLVTVPHVPTRSLDTLSYGAAATLRASFSRFDVLHFHGTALSLYTGFPRLLGTPTVLHVHARDGQRDKFGPIGKRVLRGLERLARVLPTRTAVISRTLQGELLAEHGLESFHIPQGVSLPEPTERKPVQEFGIGGQPYALYVGRLVPEKDCHVLIEAFRRSGVRGKLVLAGEASYTSRYVEELRRMAGRDVIFTGLVGEEELALLYPNATAYVQASRVEGLSMALLEAMSHGAATIVSSIPANREAVEDAALVFPTGDTDRLADHLGTLFDDHATRDRIGNRCRARVAAAYGWDSVVDATLLLYRQATGGHGSPSPLEEAARRGGDSGPPAHGPASSGRVGDAGPDPVRSTGLLLRDPGHGRRSSVPDVEAAHDGEGRGEEVCVGPPPQPGAVRSPGADSQGSAGDRNREAASTAEPRRAPPALERSSG